MFLFVGRPFFRKLFALKNDAESYRRNILGPNFQQHLLFQFKGPWALASQFSAFEKCIFHFCTIRLKPVMAPWFLEAPNLWLRCPRMFFQKKGAPIFLEAPNLWVRCSRLFFQKKGPPYFWKPLTCGYVAQGCFFPEKSPDFLKPCAKAAKGDPQIWKASWKS